MLQKLKDTTRPLRTSLRWKAARRRVERKGVPAQVLPFDWEAMRFNRTSVICSFLATRPVKSYLEIGCFGNDNFDCIPLRDKTGVDPVSGGTHRMTSDDFFAQNTKTFDLIFIDGLHHYDQVRRDIVNALAVLNEGGVIVLHDMIPRRWDVEHVPRLNWEWTGDVWKAAFEFAARDDLEMKIVTVDNGVGIITKTTKKQFVADYSFNPETADYDFFAANYRKLPLVSWEEFFAA